MTLKVTEVTQEDNPGIEKLPESSAYDLPQGVPSTLCVQSKAQNAYSHGVNLFDHYLLLFFRLASYFDILIIIIDFAHTNSP